MYAYRYLILMITQRFVAREAYGRGEGAPAELQEPGLQGGDAGRLPP